MPLKATVLAWLLLFMIVAAIEAVSVVRVATAPRDTQRVDIAPKVGGSNGISRLAPPDSPGRDVLYCRYDRIGGGTVVLVRRNGTD